MRVERVLQGLAGSVANLAVHKALAGGLGNIYGAYIMSQSKLPQEVQELVKAALL